MQCVTILRWPIGAHESGIIGEDPKGIDESIYKKPFFGKIEYSQELVNNYEDMYVDVIEKDYTWIVFAGAIVLGFVFIYLAMTHKTRKNKVS